MPNGHRPAAGARGTEPDHDSAELQTLLKDLRFDVRRIRDGLKKIVQVEWRRLQVRGIDAVFRTGLILCVLGFCLAASIAAAILIAYGIREAVAGLTQSAWIGDIGAAIGILAIAIGGGLILQHRLRDACVNKAKQDQSDGAP